MLYIKKNNDGTTTIIYTSIEKIDDRDRCNMEKKR